MNTLADRLKQSREQKGWTQAQLAVASDLSTGTIGNIESGARQSKGSLPQIAEALGISHKWLATGEGIPGEITPATREAIQFFDDATLVAEFARRIKAIPREQREPLRNEISALVMSPDSEETRAALTHYLTHGDDRLPTTTTEMIEKNREKHAAKSDTGKDSVRG